MHVALVEGYDAGQRPHQGGLAGAVRADDGDHVARLRRQAYVDRVPGTTYDHVGVEVGTAHARTGPRTAWSNHRSRSSASTATETSIRITLSTRAASWSVWSAT